MRRAGFGTTALLFVLGLFLAGCGQSKGDPKAEAPPPAKVESEQDLNVFQVDHPEQFPLASAVAHVVALTVPFALLFAATCLKLKGIPANLLSLGALDFGMVVDGAVVMVENILRHMSHGGQHVGSGKTRLPVLYQ